MDMREELLQRGPRSRNEGDKQKSSIHIDPSRSAEGWQCWGMQCQAKPPWVTLGLCPSPWATGDDEPVLWWLLLITPFPAQSCLSWTPLRCIYIWKMISWDWRSSSWWIFPASLWYQLHCNSPMSGAELTRREMNPQISLPICPTFFSTHVRAQCDLLGTCWDREWPTRLDVDMFLFPVGLFYLV